MSERTYLEEISIRNLGAIEQAHLTFGRGLNVLTGETGAGKTMILTALHLVLGGKADSSLVRHGADRLISSASFSITQEFSSVFEDAGAEIDDGSLIVTRAVGADGKSKAQCGGTALPIGTLAELTTPLIEIHGQSANAQIVKSARQRELLDRFGGEKIAQELSSYQEILSRYGALKERLAAMKSNSHKRESEIADLEEFLAAWLTLKPVRGEIADRKSTRLNSSHVSESRMPSSA